jgi:hypothetical protein
MVSGYAFKQKDGAALTSFEQSALRVCGIETNSFECMRDLGSVLYGTRDGYKLFASLSDAQLSSLEQGQKLQFRSLFPEQQAILSHLLFRRQTGLQPPRNISGTSFSLDSFLLQNPVLAFPSGIPSDAVLSLALTHELALSESKGNHPGKMWGPSDLGYIYFMQKDKGEWLNDNGGYVDVDRSTFIPGIRDDFRFELTLSSQAAKWIYLRDESVDSNTKSVGWNDFPTEYKAKFQQTLNSYRHQPPHSEFTSK